MKTFADANLSNAARIFSVANTPLFLLRKLREDASVQEIGRSFLPDEILVELRNALSATPADVEDFVRPYVYLVALGTQDARHLEKIGALNDVQKWSWEWFEYLRQVLSEVSIPTVDQTLKMPAQATTTVSRTNSAVERQLIVITD